jgi:hypothetical protein
MADGREAFARCTADALGRRIRGDQLGMGCLQPAQALDQPVVALVGDLRPVKDVVEIVMMPDLLTQAVDSPGCRGQ